MEKCKVCKDSFTGVALFACPSCGAIICPSCANLTQNICPYCYSTLDYYV